MTRPPAEMLSCPFCGGEAMLRDDTSAHGGFCVLCSSKDCFCALGEGYDRDAMPDHVFVDGDEAIAAWNRRPSPPPAPELMRLAEAWVAAERALVKASGWPIPALIEAEKKAQSAKAAFTAALGRPAQGDEVAAALFADHCAAAMALSKRDSGLRANIDAWVSADNEFNKLETAFRDNLRAALAATRGE